METETIYLLVCAFLAGFIDSVVGGGGLIQLPAYLVFAPYLPVTTALGSNKFSALMGTLVAAYKYISHTRVLWNAVLPALLACIVFSFLGAKMTSLVDKDSLRVIILVLLIVVLLYTVFKKELGLKHEPRLAKKATIVWGMLTGMVVGFYDGFFGPGTGSFLVMIFILIYGFDFMNASVSAKIINCGTNIAALIYFVYGGYVNYALAIPVGISNIAGSYLGANAAIKRGSSFVRLLFIIVVGLLTAKYGYDLFIRYF